MHAVGEERHPPSQSEINAPYTSLGEPARFSDRMSTRCGTRFGAQEPRCPTVPRLQEGAAQGTGRPRERAGGSAFALEVMPKRLLSGPWAFARAGSRCSKD
jgi:hypothetical protein